MDPRTGEVIAMASAPLFNTNDWSKTPPDLHRNVAVGNQYEPGSTFKIVPYAAALELGPRHPGHGIHAGAHDHRLGSHGARGPREPSCDPHADRHSDVGSVVQRRRRYLGQEVGKEKLADWIHRFGFTQQLGIDFPAEASGTMLPADKWSGSTIANVPIGQGISVTALQMAAAYSTVANDGVYVQPHLTLNGPAPETRRVLSLKVAGELRTMLTAAAETGRAWWLR